MLLNDDVDARLYFHRCGVMACFVTDVKPYQPMPHSFAYPVPQKNAAARPKMYRSQNIQTFSFMFSVMMWKSTISFDIFRILFYINQRHTIKAHQMQSYLILKPDMCTGPNGWSRLVANLPVCTLRAVLAVHAQKIYIQPSSCIIFSIVQYFCWDVLYKLNIMPVNTLGHLTGSLFEIRAGVINHICMVLLDVSVQLFPTLRCRQNGRDSVSNHQPHDCLITQIKKTSKLRVTGLCGGNSPGTGEFPAQMAS